MEEFLYDEFYAIERTLWWPVGMRRIFKQLLERGLDGRTSARLLDVGCGTGITLEEFRRYGSICGLDVSHAALAYTRRRDPAASVVQADARRIPIASRAIDAVLAFDVIEHLDDDRAGLREIERVLRPGGALVLNVPAFPSLWSGKDTANHHYRRYTKSSLRAALADSGFTVARLTFTNAALFLPIWLWRQIERRAKRPWNPRAEFHPRPWVNAALLGLLEVERRWLERFDFPFGTSLTGVARSSPR
jgi:SAM-dependent methyltransferase